MAFDNVECPKGGRFRKDDKCGFLEFRTPNRHENG
jgi:hypothetical protein